jgi:DnaJ-class molecular chaperone
MTDEDVAQQGDTDRPGDEVPAEEPSSGENICPECDGTGDKGGATCPNCQGTGWSRTTTG